MSQQATREEIEDANLRARGHEHALERDTDFHRDVLEYLAETDINTESKKWLEDLLSRDFVFANVNTAEMNEIVWELRYLKEIFYAAHPPQGSLLQGDTRAAIFDDPWDTLSALSDREIQEVESLFRTVRMRATRGKNMDQQKVLRTNITQSNVRRGDGESGGIWGRLRR